jgi:hypothetical protein
VYLSIYLSCELLSIHNDRRRVGECESVRVVVVVAAAVIVVHRA